METNTECRFSDWNLYAKCYDALLYLRPYQELIKSIIAHLPNQEHARLLDVACGTGNLLTQAAIDRPNWSLYGIDFSTAMLKQARGKVRGTFVQTDLNISLPVETTSYDVVTCIHALYALTEPSNFLQEAYRVLKPGGTIIVVTPKVDYDNGLILKAHAGDEGPDDAWQDGHASPARERMLLKLAIKDTSVVTKMLCVAMYNRYIARTKSFHFFTPTTLSNLFVNCGFIPIHQATIYANQSLLIIATKE